MSWMDSWSRPAKHAVTPPPLYLTSGSESVAYCQSCGRVISTRRSHTHASHASPVKYCSDRCRRTKPGPADRKIEEAFVALLGGDAASFADRHPESGPGGAPLPPPPAVPVKHHGRKRTKGDPRIVVTCGDVEALVFGSRHDPGKVFGRRKNRARRGVEDAPVWRSVDMEDAPAAVVPGAAAEAESGLEGYEVADDSDGGVELWGTDVDGDHVRFGAGKVRPLQSVAEVNFSVGGERGWAEKIEETGEMLEKRREGQRRAEEREMVRRAARRGVAFGFLVPVEDTTDAAARTGRRKKGQRADETEEGDGVAKESRRKCEAVMNGMLVEPSFAKGDWGIRWREDT